MLAPCLRDLSKHDLKQVSEGTYWNLNSAFSEWTYYTSYAQILWNVPECTLTEDLEDMFHSENSKLITELASKWTEISTI